MCVFSEYTPVTAGKSQCNICSFDFLYKNKCSQSKPCVLLQNPVGGQVTPQLLGVTPDNIMLSLI